jgi:Flp pilus assembly protein TadG
MRTAVRTRSVQHGAVLVEMALVTPILLLIMLATAEVTRAFVDHNTLTKAVRNGARYAAANALRGTTGVITVDAALSAETRNLVVYGNVAGSGTPVLTGLAPANITVTDIGGNNIQITAAHSISGMLGPVLRSFSGGSDISLLHNLQATVVMRAL